MGGGLLVEISKKCPIIIYRVRLFPEYIDYIENRDCCLGYTTNDDADDIREL